MDALLKKVEALNNQEATEFEPYEFKYEARRLLKQSIKEYEANLTNKDLPEDAKQVLTTDLMVLKHHLAVNYTDTEERSQASPILSEVVSFFISSVVMRMKYCVILMKSLNYLALIWSSLQEEKKSKKYLDQAEQLYKECYKNSNTPSIAKKDHKKLQSEFTHTLFYIAQLYKNLGNAEKSSLYCHRTLQRQLKHDQATLNKKEWVNNAVNLATFYLSSGKFRQAIHCLEAASKMSEGIQSSDDAADDADDVNIFDDDEEEKKMKADIEQSWGVLYSEMLKKSYDINTVIATQNEKLTHESVASDEKALANTQTLITLDEKLKIDNSVIMFDGIELKEPPEMELASTYNEAKELFLPGLNHLMNASGFYVLDGFVTDHTKISQSISTLYKYLAFFEKDLSTKCKLHKRRINLLKEIESQLSVNAYEDLVQDLCYELGSVYENMGSLKKEIYDSKRVKHADNTLSVDDRKQIKKINDLYSKAIHYLSKYVNIFEYPPNAQSKEMQEIPEQYRFEYFQAHFLMAALFGKLLDGGDKTEQINNAKKALFGYTHIVNFYAEKGPIDGCEVQCGIAKEMKDLLPLKISSISK
eukprot:378830_1